MNGTDLFLIGRTLMKLGEQAIPAASGSTTEAMPSSVWTVLADVLAHPGSSIGEIVARTGFPQSHVSIAIARLRDAGSLTTTPDPNDARRTIVSARHAAAASTGGDVDEVLVRALTARLGPAGARHVAEVTSALELIATRLRTPGASPAKTAKRQPTRTSQGRKRQ